ncbi:MAG: Rpn family recombination-promoting nuclease/putative transposase, partial [Trichodesmium sp. MAG_R02]|nr:Rpn family recombination-promoting nuclease/putative transposase [Trichodesmium sp. MAG_R02]
FKYTAAEMRLFFVELPKFNKSLDELETLVDKWIYFIKEADSLEVIPESLGKVSIIEKALNIANEINLSVKELELLEQRAIMAQDESGRILFAEEKGEKIGEEKGRIKGTIAMIILLLKERFEKVPEDEIATQLDGLSLADLEGLVKAVLRFNNLDDLSNWLADR